MTVTVSLKSTWARARVSMASERSKAEQQASDSRPFAAGLELVCAEDASRGSNADMRGEGKVTNREEKSRYWRTKGFTNASGTTTRTLTSRDHAQHSPLPIGVYSPPRLSRCGNEQSVSQIAEDCTTCIMRILTAEMR